MAAILLSNVWVVDPQSPHHRQWVDIRIEEGIIQQIAPANSLIAQEGEQHISNDHIYVSPGWVDMHVHLSDPGGEWKETLQELALAAVQGGFTTLHCMPNTDPVLDSSQQLESLVLRSQNLPVNIIPSGAITVGTEGKELAEMYDMQQAGAKSFTDGTHPLQHSGLMMRALRYLKAFDGLLFHYPVDTHLTQGGQMNEGVMSVRLGMPGIPETAEVIGTARDIRMLDYAPGRMHFHPMTSAEAIDDLHEKKSQHSDLSIGTNLSYFLFSDEDLLEFDTNLKLDPPLRSKVQRKALKDALEQGKIDVLASGHRAQSVEEKKLQFAMADPGSLALQTAFSIACEELIDPGLINIDRWVELIAINPRKILKLDPVCIQKGETADLSLFQEMAFFTLRKEQIPSRAKNSYLLNQERKGKALGIIRDGQFFQGIPNE
ncbi:MAG: dihydroorotase [Bacteroidota bacterium]